MRDHRFLSSRTLIDAHTQTKIDAFLLQMALCGAFTIVFTLTFCGRQVSKTLLERVSGVFAQLLSNKYVRDAKIVAIFREFDCFRNKAKMRDFSQKCGNKGEMGDFPHDCGMVDTYDKLRLFYSCTVFSTGGVV